MEAHTNFNKDLAAQAKQIQEQTIRQGLVFRGTKYFSAPGDINWISHKHNYETTVLLIQ